MSSTTNGQPTPAGTHLAPSADMETDENSWATQGEQDEQLRIKTEAGDIPGVENFSEQEVADILGPEGISPPADVVPTAPPTPANQSTAPQPPVHHVFAAPASQATVPQLPAPYVLAAASKSNMARTLPPLGSTGRQSTDGSLEPPRKIMAVGDLAAMEDRISGVVNRNSEGLKESILALHNTMQSLLTLKVREAQPAAKKGDVGNTGEASTPVHSEKTQKYPWDDKRILTASFVAVANAIHQGQNPPFNLSSGRLEALRAASRAAINTGIWQIDSLKVIDEAQRKAESSMRALRFSFPNLKTLRTTMALFRAEAEHYRMVLTRRFANEYMKGLHLQRGPINKKEQEARSGFKYYIPNHAEIFEMVVTQTLDFREYQGFALLRQYGSLDEATAATEANPDQVFTRGPTPKPSRNETGRV